MTYSKTPTGDTYSQEDIFISKEVTSRQNDPLGLKDEIFINSFVEVVKDKRLGDSRTFAYKRAGSGTYITPPISGTIRGTYYWKDAGFFVYAIDTNVYLYNVTSGATTTCTAVFTSSTSSVGFSTFLYDTEVVVLIATDGTKLVKIDTAGAVTACADANLPVPHLPKPIFIDGYLVLVKSLTATIYNSDLNDPMSWTVDNLIDAEMEGDLIFDIEKLNNYLVVFGSSTIEYFWDAGGAGGSPFKRNDTPVKINGYIGGLAKAGNAIYYVGYNVNNAVDVFKLQDFTIEEIGSDTVRRYTASLTTSDYPITGYVVVNLGHTFYQLVGGPRTFVYDVNEKFWSKWAYQATSSFPISTATTIISTTGNITVFSIHGTNILHKFENSLYRDNGVDFTVTIMSEASDFGTMNRKTMSRLSVVGDRPSADSSVTISISDDDFQTFYGNYLVNMNQDLPSYWRLGSFRQRIIKLTYTDNYPMRIQKFQATINKGRN
jgi:hypothetical protein